MFRECIILFGLLIVTRSTCSIPSSEINSFLNAHNSLRRSISDGKYVARGKKMPAAKTPIENMTWDCEIENNAQKEIDSCIFAHSQNRMNLGENIWMMWMYDKLKVEGMANKACNSWEIEFQKFGWKDIKLTLEVFNTGIGHATQMAWARSTKLGCGMTLCHNHSTVLVVCQYRNAGNFINYDVYEPK